jgi:hypothetical protein
MNDLTRVIRECERRGLRCEQGRKHAKLRDTRTNRFVSISGTPSDRNAHRNVLRDVRKYLGVELTL